VIEAPGEDGRFLTAKYDTAGASNENISLLDATTAATVNRTEPELACIAAWLHSSVVAPVQEVQLHAVSTSSAVEVGS
jgi:hypothetical protein